LTFLGPQLVPKRLALLKDALLVLSQKVARWEVENQLFERIQDWRARC